MKLKDVIISIFFILSLSLSSAQSLDVATEDNYKQVILEYSQTLDDYEDLLDDYDNLIIEFREFKNEHEKVIIDYEKLNNLYLMEIEFHLRTRSSLNTARSVIVEMASDINYLMKITDTNYFVIYPQVGYAGSQVSFGIGGAVRIPNFPISLLIDLDYIPEETHPLNIQLGVGISL